MKDFREWLVFVAFAVGIIILFGLLFLGVSLLFSIPSTTKLYDDHGRLYLCSKSYFTDWGRTYVVEDCLNK